MAAADWLLLTTNSARKACAQTVSVAACPLLAAKKPLAFLRSHSSAAPRLALVHSLCSGEQADRSGSASSLGNECDSHCPHTAGPLPQSFASVRD